MADAKQSEDNNANTEHKQDNDDAQPYCICDIYSLYNAMETSSTLLLDVRSKSEYEADHITNGEHFEIPNDFKFTNHSDLLLKLNKNIEEFKAKVFNKLQTTKKKDLSIYCYGDDAQTNEKYNVLYQLSIIFGLKREQLQILCDPGFSSFGATFPFLCSKYIKEEEQKRVTDFSSMLDALKNKNKIKDDGTLYGKIKSQDRKYPNSILTNKLFLGNAEHSKDSKVLGELKITHIVNATLQYKNEFESVLAIKYMQIAIDDAENESFESYWNEIIKFIDCIQDDKCDNRVFVHCEMGISRSATICIAYLMKRMKMTLFDAYCHVLNNRPIIRPNASFLKQLEAYEKSLFDEVSTLDKVNKSIREIYLQNAQQEQQ
eukprot:197589_1